MKKIFIFLILILLIAIVATILFRTKISPAPNVPAPDTYSDIGSPEIGSGSVTKFPISTNQGLVEVADVTKYSEFDDVGDGTYSLSGTRSNPEASFSMIYSKTDNSYAIAILSEPIAANREEASKYLLELLRINQTEACKLNVYIGTVYSVNPNMSGRNFGLSFCPGSEKL